MVSGLRSALVVLAAVCWAAPAGAQASKSAPLATQLVQQLQERQLQNVAAKDPDRAGFFVAVAHIPGLQLLLVSAQSNAPDYVQYVIDQKRYDEAYASLNGASLAEGKLFVQDMGANGLLAEPGEGAPIDIAYRDEVKTTVFNGDWKQQGLSREEYAKIFDEVDARYARALSLLLEQLKSSS